MLLDFKTLFTKGSSLGRFEYIKVAWGLLLFPMLMIQLATITPPNNLLYYLVITIAVITITAYLIISWVATYKRFNNIFNNNIISVIFLIFFIFSVPLLNKVSLILSWILMLMHIILSILLLVIPGKKKSDNIVSSKLFWIMFPLLILFVFSFSISGINRIVPAESMANTLQANDRIILNIFDKDYHRGDIVIHKTNKKRVEYVKRIVALPGEKVEIKTLENGSHYIFINDKLLNESYVKSVYEYPECSPEMLCGPTIVPENSYYVLGDNRGNSFDSRFYGFIDKNSIKGKVSHIWYPFNRLKVFKTLQYSN